MVVVYPADLSAVGENGKTFHESCRNFLTGGVEKIVGGQIEVSVVFETGKVAVKDQTDGGKTADLRVFIGY